MSYSPLQPFLSRHTTLCVTKQKRLQRRLALSKLESEGWGNIGEPPCLLSILANSRLACVFYHSLLCSPLGMKSLLTCSSRGCWSYNMELCCRVGVEMTLRKKDRSRGDGYITILFCRSEAKVYKTTNA